MFLLYRSIIDRYQTVTLTDLAIYIHIHRGYKLSLINNPCGKIVTSNINLHFNIFSG